MKSTPMDFYKALSRIRFLKKSYVLKFLFVAFLGIHVPLIGIVIYVGLYAPKMVSPVDLLLLTLGFTLAATAVTLFVLNKLLQPVKVAKQILLNYHHHRVIPDLQDNFQDEIGVLLQSIQFTIQSLDTAQKTKQEMMYTITHDLRSPLSQIISLTDLLRKEQDSRDKWLDMIRAAAQQELSFIDNYMSILETLDYRLEEQATVKVGLQSIVNQVVEMMKPKLEGKQLSVHTDISPVAIVNTTKELLFERVVRNLVSNAIKFSHPGGTIVIRSFVSNEETILEVSDSGIGFYPGSSAKLFEKFTSLKKEGTAGEEANGIGLYLTREIVKKHNGIVEAKSNGPGTGATFTVKLKNK